MIRYLSMADAFVMIRSLRSRSVVRDTPWALIRTLEARANYINIPIM